MQTAKQIVNVLGNIRKHDITFHSTGRIDITARIAKYLSIQPGDVLELGTDGDEWYLYVNHVSQAAGRYQAQCYPTNKGRSNNFRTYSKTLCSAVLSLSGGNIARIPAGKFTELPDIGKAVIIIPKYNLSKQ